MQSGDYFPPSPSFSEARVCLYECVIVHKRATFSFKLFLPARYEACQNSFRFSLRRRGAEVYHVSRTRYHVAPFSRETGRDRGGECDPAVHNCRRPVLFPVQVFTPSPPSGVSRRPSSPPLPGASVIVSRCRNAVAPFP